MITPEIKDRVLKYLCENLQPENYFSLNVQKLLKEVSQDFDNINSVLIYFQRVGFVEDLNSRRTSISLVLRTEANDFLLRGGFKSQEELIQNNIQKLLLEIDNLQKQLGPNHLETINKLSAISSAIISGIGLFK